MSPSQLFSNLTFIMMMTMTISSGLPIIYPISCLCLVVFYWLQKLLILKYHAKTPQFTYDLPKWAIWFLYIGIFLHVMFAAIVFKHSAPTKQFKKWLDDKVDREGNFRTFLDYTLLYFNTGIVVGFYLASFLVIFIIRAIIKLCVQCCDIPALDEEDAMSSFQIGSRRITDILLGHQTLYNLYKQSKIDLSEYQLSDLKKVDEYQLFGQSLDKKVECIEQAIDKHYVSLQGPQQEALSHDQKLVEIRRRHTELEKTYEQDNVKRLRMKGKIQSYDVFDTENCKNMKEIKQKIIVEDIQQQQNLD